MALGTLGCRKTDIDNLLEVRGEPRELVTKIPFQICPKIFRQIFPPDLPPDLPPDPPRNRNLEESSRSIPRKEGGGAREDR